MKSYEDYMTSSPMTDGEEMRDFFNCKWNSCRNKRYKKSELKTVDFNFAKEYRTERNEQK